MNKKNSVILIIFIILVSIGWKSFLLAQNAFSFNSDEAIVALMARHILQGNFPLFFYGQSYMGSLDAFLVAAVFTLVGQKVLAIRILQTTLYVFVLLTSWMILALMKATKRQIITSLLLLSIPTVNVTLYTTVSLGGYNEALIIGNCILILTLLFVKDEHETIKYHKKNLILAGIGFFAGFGLWVNGLTLVYSFSSFFYIIWYLYQRRREFEPAKLLRNFSYLITGTLFGSIPWLVFAFGGGFSSLMAELFGSAIAINQTSYFQQVGQHFLSFILFGISVILGLRPPFSVEWLLLPMIPFVLFGWGCLIVGMVKAAKEKSRNGIWLQIGYATVLLLAFILTPFGGDPSGRYFIPVYQALAMLAGIGLSHLGINKYFKTLLIVGLVLFNFFGTIQCIGKGKPGITTQFYEPTQIDHTYDDELIAFLLDNGEIYGYTNYWVSYPIAFLSQEQIVFIPKLPYHPDLKYTERDDRYTPYQEKVKLSNKVAYITTNNLNLDKFLRNQFTHLEIEWEEEKIGDYQVFYDLSKLILPEKIGL
ncbi:MAG: hypothetical protein JEZ03_18250, partial [Bacteroidales bacterium]|nr:hypothetical protein [Bacteroidales bacterium]